MLDGRGWRGRGDVVVAVESGGRDRVDAAVESRPCSHIIRREGINVNTPVLRHRIRTSDSH